MQEEIAGKDKMPNDSNLLKILFIIVCVIEILPKNWIFAIGKDLCWAIIAVNFKIAILQSAIDINYHNPKIITALTTI